MGSQAMVTGSKSDVLYVHSSFALVRAATTNTVVVSHALTVCGSACSSVAQAMHRTCLESEFCWPQIPVAAAPILSTWNSKQDGRAYHLGVINMLAILSQTVHCDGACWGFAGSDDKIIQCEGNDTQHPINASAAEALWTTALTTAAMPFSSW